MPHRGNKNNDRGRGFRGSPRGGRGRGRGGRGFRGTNGPMGRGRGRGQGMGFLDDTDFVVQVWPDEGNGLSRRGGSRGRGTQSPYPRNDTGNNHRGNTTPRGQGTPRGRGRGYGRGINQSDSSYTPRRGMGPRSNVPLSSSLERPLLKPIKFVPSVYTKILFEEEEDLLQSVPENAGPTEQNNAPTADRVARVFSGNFPSQQDLSSDNESDENEDQLEEINFEDMHKIRDEVEAAASVTVGPSSEVISIEERFMGFYVDPKAGASPTRTTGNDSVDTREAQEEFDGNATNEDEDGRIFLPDDSMDTSTAIAESHVSIKDDQARRVITETQIQIEQLDRRETSGFSSQTIFAISGDDKSPIVNIHTRSTLDQEENESPLFFIDTTPEKPHADTTGREIITVGRALAGAPLGEPDEEIVYVAPHPRSGKIATVPSEHTLPLFSTSILTGTTNPTAYKASAMDGQLATTSVREQSDEPAFSSVSFSFASPSPKKQPRNRPIFSVGERSKAKAKARKKEARVIRRRMERQAMFGSFGAILSEERLRDEDWKGKGKDPKWEQRRRGDSDIDWGDDDEDEDANEEVADAMDEISNGLGGMDLDPEIGMDIPAMKGFVSSMSSNGGRHITMDDIADEERMKQEDEEESDSHGSEGDGEDDDGDSSDSEEQEVVFAVEEEILIAEADGEDFQEDAESGDEFSEDSSSDDDDQSPKSGFQARLRKLREKARARKTADIHPESEIESSDEDPPWTRADGDDRYIAHIEAMLEENSHIVNGPDRKERKALFRAVQNGTLDDFYEFDDGIIMTPAKRKKQKKKDIPTELQTQWEKDRLKKAEYKRLRNEARLLDAIDPMTPKKGGKKGRKAMLAAARLDDAKPNKVVDLVSLDQQIRRFIANLGGKQEMVLPPMDKYSRKMVHELANAFNLKSVSKGGGKGRYTTLIKTTRTGIDLREGKIRNILRRAGGDRFDRPDDHGSGKGKGRDRGQMPRHKDGDEVGKAAPKIGENNIGFKMLASMGWSEGERIGVSSFGLHAPLTAVIKNTKSGLGATR